MREFGGGGGGDVPRGGDAPYVSPVWSIESSGAVSRERRAELARQLERAKQDRSVRQSELAGRLERARRARAAELAERDAQAERGEKNPESDSSALADHSTGLTSGETEAFVKDSLGAFAQAFAQSFADAHGIGLIFRVAKWVYGASKWARVAEGDGGLAVQAPLPMGPDVVLDVSVHLGGDPDTPPLTFCIAPGGESGVGALSLGKLEVDPETSHATASTDRLKVSHEGPGSVEIVPLRLSKGLTKDLEAAQAVGAARKLAEHELLPGLRQRQQALHEAGVDLVLGYDSATGLAVWVDLSAADRASEPVVTPVEDQLRIGVSQGAADLVISHDPFMGLRMLLQPRADEGRSSPVLIWDESAAHLLETATMPKVGTDPSESFVPIEGVTPAASEGLSELPAADHVAGTPARQSPGQGAGLTVGGVEGSTAEMPVVTLTRLVPVPVASVRSHVASWLLQNGALLSKLVGIDIELESREDTAGKFAIDIIGREVATGSPMIIEAQHGPADYQHLGQILTYASDFNATTVIWVAEEFGEKHRAALDWLNAHTDQTVRFFGVRLAVLTLEAAPAGLIAPHLELVVRPNKG